METILNGLLAALAVWIPAIISALLILIFGWIIAKILAWLTGKLLGWIKLDERLAKGMEATGEQPASVEKGITQFVYYVVIFLTILGALNALGMTGITTLFGGMLTEIFNYLPSVISAVVLALIAWFVARILRALVTRLLARVGTDKKVSEQAGTAQAPISTSIGEAVYWIVWLLFLPMILGVLGLTGILIPINAMLTNLLGILPALFAAAVILVIGLFVARILQRISASALHAFGVDALSDRVGLSRYLGKPGLSGLIGYIVYILVIIPVIIAALNATGLTYLAAPLSDMLNKVLAAIPNIFVAVVVLGVAYFIARVIADLVATLLSNAGFDNLVARVSIGTVSETPKVSPSKIVGWVVLTVIMLFAAMATAGILGWTAMVVILGAFISFLARLLVGFAILVVGIFLANLASRLILSTGLEAKRVLALLARVAIIIFAAAMALDQIGVANDIVNLTFGLILAGTVLAGALAFGLGGRDVAHYQLVRMYRSAEAALGTPPPPAGTLPDVTPPAETPPDVTPPAPTVP